MHRPWLSLFAVVFQIAVCNAAAAQVTVLPFGGYIFMPSWDEAVARSLPPGQRAARFVEELRVFFVNLDLDSDGFVSTVDRRRSLQSFDALYRAHAVSQFLRADFDGNGVVTRVELERYRALRLGTQLGLQGPQAAATQPDHFGDWGTLLARADRNRDGQVDWTEIVTFAYGARTLPVSLDAAYQILLGFDVDGDGRINIDEYNAGLERLFEAKDMDGDGVISTAEFEAVWRDIGRSPPQVNAVAPSYEETLAETCKVPRAPRDAKIMLVRAYGAVALSSVAVGSQDETTQAVRVTVEPGSEPLYLVLISSNRLLWQFSGAVDRIKRLVLASIEGTGGKTIPLAAVGLPPEVVTFGGPDKCTTFWVNMIGQDLKRAGELLRILAGRGPGAIKSVSELWELKLPSGETIEPRRANHGELRVTQPGPMALSRLREDFDFFYPGGVMQIDPKTVVASLPVEPYDVLPNQAGLVQLMERGALEAGKKDELIIRRAIRFPAGLSGAHAVRFVLGKGVPEPTGDPGHSSVISEETGARLCFNASCRQRR